MIDFIADKVLLRGPKIDGSWVITFEVGEYMYQKIKDLPTLNGKNIKVVVENE